MKISVVAHHQISETPIETNKNIILQIIKGHNSGMLLARYLKIKFNHLNVIIKFYSIWKSET
jgi:hypothetical protein